MLRVFLAGALALAWLSIADAQTYPSPHFNNVTIDGKVNSLSLPTSNFVGEADTQTLTNKSISGAEINSGAVGTAYGGTGQNWSSSSGIPKIVSGTSTLVAAPAGDLVGTSDAQVLTNKQIDASEITSGVIGYGFLPIGTTANTVAAGNDSRIVGALQTTGGTMTGVINSTLPAFTGALSVTSNNATQTYGVNVSNTGTGDAVGLILGANNFTGANTVQFSQAATGAANLYVQGHSYDFDKNGNLTGTTNLATISSLAPIATSGSASDLSTGTLATARLPSALLSSTTIPSPIITHSLADNLTSTGSTQATALLVTQSINAFTSVASGTGAILPTTDPSSASISAGYVIEILNAGANSLLVYPPSGQSIEGQGANNPVTVAAGGDVRFVYRGSVSGVGAWYAR